MCLDIGCFTAPGSSQGDGGSCLVCADLFPFIEINLLSNHNRGAEPQQALSVQGR